MQPGIGKLCFSISQNHGAVKELFSINSCLNMMEKIISIESCFSHNINDLLVILLIGNIVCNVRAQNGVVAVQ